MTGSTTGSAPAPGWLARLRTGLSKTAGALGGGIAGLLGGRKIDRATLQELEDQLVAADLGVRVAGRITKRLGDTRMGRELTPVELREALAEEIAGVLAPAERALDLTAAKPFVVLVVGVNGTGKTTTIGKLAARMRGEGRKVMIAAGDTFRAAAIEQLRVWGERAGAEVVADAPGADAAGLAFNALQKAREAKADVLLIDTAGRLQNKADLMAELAKIVRVLRKLDTTAPHAVLLVLDATTGQNARSQVEVFRGIAEVSGLVMAKLDGTARGGMLVAIAEEFGLPVYFIGVGEGVDDLQPFRATAFARSLVGLEP